MKVDFFIIGAPKCGTTAMAYYLSQHPQICMADPKEPWFFSEDLEVGYPDLPTTVDGYHNRYFSHYDSRVHTRVGEASPIYMVSSCAVDKILAYNPNAKFIAMVRNPVDIAYAMHANRYATSPNHENIAGFEDAWMAQEDRLAGRKLPANVIKPILLQYRKIASIGTQLKTVMDKVPPGNLLILVNEDMRSNTQQSYNETLAFLGLEPYVDCDFSPANENKVWADKRMETIYHGLNALKQRMPFKVNLGLLSALKRKSFKTGKRPSLPSRFRAELVNEFRPEVELLSSLLNRDFSHWQ